MISDLFLAIAYEISGVDAKTLEEVHFSSVRQAEQRSVERRGALGDSINWDRESSQSSGQRLVCRQKRRCPELPLSRKHKNIPCTFHRLFSASGTLPAGSIEPARGSVVRLFYIHPKQPSFSSKFEAVALIMREEKQPLPRNDCSRPRTGENARRNMVSSSPHSRLIKNTNRIQKKSSGVNKAT